VLTFWLRKFTMAGEALRPDCPPVPVSGTVWVPPASVRSRFALSAPSLPGVKPTATVHVWPEAIAPVHVLAPIAKFAAPGPEIAVALIGWVGASPLFLIVTVRLVVVLTRCVPKSPLPGAAKKIGMAGVASLPSTVNRSVPIPPTGSPGPVTRKKLFAEPTTVWAVTPSPM
jgi:hypothetical protein